MTIINYMVFSNPSWDSATQLCKLIKRAMGRDVQAFHWKNVPLHLIEVEVAPLNTPPTAEGRMRLNLVVDTNLHHKIAMSVSDIQHGEASERVEYNNLGEYGVVVGQSEVGKSQLEKISNRISLDIARLVMTRMGIRYIEAVGDHAAADAIARKAFVGFGIKPQVNDFSSDWDGSY